MFYLKMLENGQAFIKNLKIIENRLGFPWIFITNNVRPNNDD